jgi:hypothetical protein
MTAFSAAILGRVGQQAAKRRHSPLAVAYSDPDICGVDHVDLSAGTVGW